MKNEIEDLNMKSSNSEIDRMIRLKELEIEEHRNELKSRLIKVWAFCVVVLAVVAIELLSRDDNPNSVGYLLLLLDFNLVVWPVLIYIQKESNHKAKRKK